MKKGIFFKKLSAFLFVPAMFLMSLCGYYKGELPDRYYVYTTDKPLVSTVFPIDIEYESARQTYGSTNSETCCATMKLLGVFPIKDIEVEAIGERYVIPGGEPFGIKIMSDGVMVVSISDIEGISPANESGLRVGDIITSIEGNEVSTNSALQEIIADSQGQTLAVDVVRNDEELELALTPIFSDEQGQYCAGIWVRDSSAGIGTMTFYDPQSGAFGGLGHAVCDSDTREIVPLLSGKVTGVEIFNINKSSKGTPGELCGRFINENICGTITVNNDCGVFGYLNEFDFNSDLIQLGLKQDISIGEAKMLTTIDGDTPCEYDIYIEDINYNSKDGLKSITIRVTDQDILESCGGIVRGMSGSPIIQNNKLVAAVTHVFVNDPTKGYAVFAETMLDSIG
ncbi:MAG: SpoIVB peptidase [Oscillospiraceae bacterium]|nr:SpoIVB peptidase [Oscillospiraceae bacterium]